MNRVSTIASRGSLRTVDQDITVVSETRRRSFGTKHWRLLAHVSIQTSCGLFTDTRRVGDPT